jgi:hypothetical protein
MTSIDGSDDYSDQSYTDESGSSEYATVDESGSPEYTTVDESASEETSSVIPSDEPAAPTYEETDSTDTASSPIAEPAEGYEQSVIPSGQPGGPAYEEPAAEETAPPEVASSPVAEPAEGYEQSVIPPGQPGGPGYEAPVDPANTPVAEPVEGYEQSVIPTGQPGGPSYEQAAPELPTAYDSEGNPAIYGVTPNGESSAGTWWTTGAPVVECCVPLPEYTPGDTGTATGLVFVDSDARTETLPGIDSNGDGVADFSTLDANRDGKIDSWFVDSTGTGTVDSIYYDADGDGLPEAVTNDVESTGRWSNPRVISEAFNVIPSGQPGGPPATDTSVRELNVIPPGQPGSDVQASPADDLAAFAEGEPENVIPTGQPGGPAFDPAVATALAGYQPGPGANLSFVCSCTTDPQAQAAIARIAVAESTPAPPPVLDAASDTETPPPTDVGMDPSTATLPETWEAWQPPTEPSPESFTDAGYSTDWGQITPEWAENGEAPFPVSEPEQPLSTLIGPGHEADVYWAYQGNTNYCGIYSVRAILSEMYGQQVDVNEMIQRAEQNGWLVYENGVVKGIYPETIEKILESYGVPSTDRAGSEGAWEALNTALTNNQRIVLAIDAKEITARANVGTEVPGVDWDHFVSITGIDYEKGVVIMNDSARSAGLELPIDVFKDAWADSNYRMTITDTSARATGAAAPAGYALLGTTVEARLA